MKDTWSPQQYERFQHERSLPFFDLVALLQRRPALSVLDLGCGTGRLTRILHETLGAERTLGVDRSESMLAQAEKAPGLDFARGDLADLFADAPPAWAGGSRYDVVFSNAALQWLPDHERLLARIVTLIAPGGQLAVQVPANFDDPPHRIADALAREAPFRDALAGQVRELSVLAPVEYSRLLFRLGLAEQRVRLEVYAHELPSREGVIDWVKGTLLTMYAARLPPDLYAQFLERYRERLLAVLPDERPYLLSFKRILFWGRLPA